MMRGLALAAASGLLAAVLILGLRPWYLHWGATPEEMTRRLPGDEIVTAAGPQGTRAITIDTPVERVWPWLAQIGQDRGGFYSYDLLENLVGCEMPTEDVLRPDKQSWALGDRLWMYPAQKAEGIGFATLRVYVPGRALGFGTRMTGTSLDQPENGSWSFVLEPIDPTHTRALVRGRGATGRSLLGTAFDQSIFEPAHYAMERRMLIGLKQVAEGGSRERWKNDLQVMLWMIVFAMVVLSVGVVVAGRRWGRGVLAFLGTAGIFQVLTLGQPHPAIGVGLTAVAGVLLFWAVRPSPGAQAVS
jgi:hypothetical protein